MFQWFYKIIVLRFPQEVDSTSEDIIEEWIREGKSVKHGNNLKVEMLVQNGIQKYKRRVKNGYWMKILANQKHKL
jgi:hypothetical protein